MPRGAAMRKKATRPVDRLGGAHCELTERGVAALKKIWG
jgi:hypothetical protein